MAIQYTILSWQVSNLFLVGTANGLASIEFMNDRPEAYFVEALQSRYHSGPIQSSDRFSGIISALNRYFAGEKISFNFPLDLTSGTTFQRQVWAEVMKIPYGQTRTYMQIAASLGRSGAVRAVGQANGKNPIPIVIPCHRVIQSNGSLGGYGGGLTIKDYLLRLEGAIF